MGTGSFLSDPHYRGITLLDPSRFDQLKELGINFIVQRAVKSMGEERASNLKLLAEFPYILALNDSGTGTGNSNYDADEPENTDWINYFTQAKYRKWEAEGDNIFKGNVRIKHKHGEIYSDGNVSGWATNNSTKPGDLIMYGPDYWQYPKYTFSNPEWNPFPVVYNAAFTMRIDSKPASAVPVCSLAVTMSFKENDIVREIVLQNKTLTTADFSGNLYTEFILQYDYRNYINLSGSKPGYNHGKQVQFKVIWLGSRKLYIDKIEVYDQTIWGKYFRTARGYKDMISFISSYDKSFAAGNPAFYSRLKYYLTLDEPHSIDCYEPLRKVQEILDSLNTGADLITHWFPGWDALRDGDNTWDQYYPLVKPHKLHFWYAPFTCNSNSVPDNSDFTLWFFRYNLQYAAKYQPGFMLAAQTFGYQKNDGTYDRWMTPTPAEVKAQTMLALAHGCKGIWYEGYYSECPKGSTQFQGLVKCPDSSFAPRDIWYTVKEITARLKGPLGNTLMSLEYDTKNDSGYLRLYPGPTSRDMIDKVTAGTVQKRYLQLSSDNSSDVNFHAGFFKSSSQTDNNYFLLTNLNTTKSKQINVRADRNGYHNNNIRFRDIEPLHNLDTTYSNFLSLNMMFPPGEGYLFQVAPVIKNGGKLFYNDTVKTGDTELTDNMIIKDGVILTIENDLTYTIKDTITLEGSGSINGAGYINIVPDGEIITSSWQSSIFKGVNGDHPGIYISKPLKEKQPANYQVYRKKDTSDFILIGDISGTSMEFIDSTTVILKGSRQSGDAAEYYIKANINGVYKTTNIITYARVE